MSTCINMWGGGEKVSVAQLMGEENADDMRNDEDALLAEADRMTAVCDERRATETAGWDDVVVDEMPED